MMIVGCDYHPGFQQIAFVDCETGDCGERRLEHREAAEKFYRDLAAQGKIGEARVQFLAATRYRPDFAPAHLNLGLILAKLGKPDQALREFGTTLQIDPTNLVAQEYMGTLHTSRGSKLEGEAK